MADADRCSADDAYGRHHERHRQDWARGAAWCRDYMCWLGIMTEKDACNYVDWNVMAILVGVWIIG